MRHNIETGGERGGMGRSWEGSYAQNIQKIKKKIPYVPKHFV